MIILNFISFFKFIQVIIYKKKHIYSNLNFTNFIIKILFNKLFIINNNFKNYLENKILSRI